MIFTIDSDDEVPLEIDEEEEKKVEIIPATKTKKSKGGKKKEEPAFHFEFDAGDIAPLPSRKKKAQDNTSDQSEDDESDIDEDRVKVIDKKAPKLRKQDKNSKMEEEVDAEEDFGMDDDDEKEFFDEVIDTTSKGKKLSNNNGNQYESDIIFAQLNLSRPFLRAIEAMGYTTPTPIQTQVIPHALAGRDICASAVTGSGKTAAFLLPALERLLYRPKDIPAIRVLVITPTRELATQIYDVLQKLSQFTDITSLLICGGNKDVRSQEAQLKQEPDIVICTPGRMLDHLRNSLSITLDYLNILILDEVDRLLELGFQEEVEELIKYCPYQRQTMLFSATMTPKIEDLIKLSLKKPLRIKTDSSKITIASRLIQEFIKLKNISESLTAMNNSSMTTPARKNFFEQQKEKEAILLALIHRSFHTRTIVFFELKKNAQRFCALLNLSGIRAVELHGDLPQIQRYMSLESFRTGEVEVLVATDVAARGIDISQVQTVINAEMPRNISIYIHRVGRTARAGCGGRSITLVSEDRRKIMKEVLKEEAKKIAAQRLAAEEEEQKNGNKTKKNNKNEKEEKKKEVKKQKKSDDDDNDDDDNDEEEDDEEEQEEEEKDQWDDDDDKEKKNGFSTNQILSRNVPSNVVQHYLDKINNLEPSLANYLQEERHRRQIDQLEREAERAQNILLHQDEIQSRPARTWFQTETQKQQLRTLSKERIRSEREALSNPRKRTLSQGEEGDEGDNDSDDDGEEEDDMMLESERKLKELSTADDYRIDENDKSNKKLLQHRLSRKKRRRLEALEASREADEEGDEGQSNRKSTPAASVKQVKQQQREKQREKLGVAGKTAGELTMKKVTVVEAPVKRVNDGEDDDGESLNRAKGKKRTKVVRQTFAYGGLDQDIYESSTSSRLSKKKAVKNEAEDWKEFDPTKRLKKGGKAGTASFKSKKKYKRRK